MEQSVKRDNERSESLVNPHHKGGQVTGIRDREAEVFQFIGSAHDRAYLKATLQQAGFVVEEPDLTDEEALPLLYLESRAAAAALAPGDRVRLTTRGFRYQGKTGTVDQITPGGRLLVRIDGRRDSLAFAPDEVVRDGRPHERS